MVIATRWLDSLVLAGLGAATGVVTWALVEHAADALGDAVAWIGPGLVYGLVVAAYVRRVSPQPLARLAWLVLGMMVSWNLAVRLAGNLYEATDRLALAGGAAGLVGAAVVAGAAALAHPAWRRPRPAVAIVAAGTLGGLLLIVDSSGGLPLYVVWQGAVAAVLGLALGRPTRR